MCLVPTACEVRRFLLVTVHSLLRSALLECIISCEIQKSVNFVVL